MYNSIIIGQALVLVMLRCIKKLTNRLMKKLFRSSLVTASLTLMLINTNAQQSKDEISIIPMPEKLERAKSNFTISPVTRIVAEQGDAEALRIANLFAKKLQQASGYKLVVTETTKAKASKDEILFTTHNADASLGAEGYRLSVTNSSVTVSAVKPAGLFYGMQTINQLLPTAIEGTSTISNIAWTLPGIEIKDKPRFSWRGMHLDVGRHFMPLDFIKKYIDAMAMHKLNAFHWHLTEDQGWRIEIKKYPKLTEIGAWRKESLVGHMNDKPHKYDGIPHGGFYTQDQCREIVQYAKERFITVIPEIEMPGHAKAAIASYPELGVTGKPVEVATEWEYFLIFLMWKKPRLFFWRMY